MAKTVRIYGEIKPPKKLTKKQFEAEKKKASKSDKRR